MAVCQLLDDELADLTSGAEYENSGFLNISAHGKFLSVLFEGLELYPVPRRCGQFVNRCHVMEAIVFDVQGFSINSKRN